MSELIYGTNLVKAAISEDIKIKTIYVYNENKVMISFLKDKGLSFQKVDKVFLDKKIKNHQGIIAEVDGFRTYELKDIINPVKTSLIVMLEGLEDPHNLGAVLRTADAAGVAGVVIPKNRSVKLNSTVAKVSTGAIFSVKTVEVVNFVQTIEKLKEAGYWVVGAEATTKSVDYRVLNMICLLY